MGPPTIQEGIAVSGKREVFNSQTAGATVFWASPLKLLQNTEPMLGSCGQANETIVKLKGLMILAHMFEVECQSTQYTFDLVNRMGPESELNIVHFSSSR